MNCYTHKEQNATGLCKACQKAVCPDCAIDTGRGLACSTQCAEEVGVLNIIVDRSKQIYGIGSSSKLPSTGIIMYFFFGLMFFGFGIYNSLNREQSDYLTIFLGLGFIVMSIFTYIRTKNLKLNC